VRASFNPDDGVVFPWPFVWGYARAARDLGVTRSRPSPRWWASTRGNGRITGVRLRPTARAITRRGDEVLPAGDAFTVENATRW
jgi:glycine/D-amino acid oxidase-like deaminating enzyme